MLITVEKLVETQNILSKTKKKRKKTRPDEENDQEAKLNKSSGAKERKNSEAAANSSSSGSDEYFLEWRIDEKYIQNQNLYSCGSSSSVDDLERIGTANNTTTDAPSSSFLRSTAATPSKRVDYQKVPNVSLIRSSIISSPDNKSSSLNERIMLEMEQTNKYNDLFFEKQRRNNNGSNNNESRTTSILDQFHQSYLDPSRNGRLQTINDDENEEKTGTKTTTKRSISARPVGPALVEDVVDEWDEFARFLEHILDVYAYRDSSLFIDEFRRLEAYLMAEYEQNEETAEMGDDAERATVYFMNQQQIADHLNDLIKIKQFQLSQSKALFESTKNSFFELLEVKLSPNNLNECQARFDKYCQNYFFIFDQIKSKLKLKMSKYENYIKIWNDFDSDCEDLDLTFEELKDKRINCNLKYRSKELEITNVLNRLKAGLCSLAPVCHENKYYELKQKIIQYEIALKNFRSQNEQLLNQRSKLTTSTPSSQQKNVDIQIDRHVYKEDNRENRMMSFADLEEHRPPRERRNNSSSIYYEPLSMRQKVRPTTVTPIRIDRDYEDDLDDEEEVSDEYVDTDYMVRSVSSRSAVKRPPFVGFSDLSPANRSMRRRRFNGVQMSDKSTATINDCATQTDSFRDERELPLDIDSMGESNKQHERQQQHEPLTRYMDTTPVKSSSTSGADLDHHHNHLVETEGKKLLLEAYLRTNDNLALIKQQQQQQGQQNQENKTSDHHHNDTTTATSTPNKTPSSSQQSSQMMAKKPSHHHHRHNSKHTDTITVTTSGIGTATNDEEEEADDDDGHNTTTSSNQSMYDEFLYKNGHKLTVVEENIEPSVGQSTSRRRKSSKKQQQGDQQIQQQQQPSNEPSSKKLLKLLPLKAPVSVGASSSSCSTLDLDSKRHPRREKFLPFLSQKQAAKAKLSTLDNNATNSAARKSDVDQVDTDTKQRASIFQRLLQYVLLFLIPLLFIILVYFIYIYFLNPSCCDFKRNYLFINVS